MTGNEDIEMLAAEYVLGTLDAGERAMVAARRRREPALESAIAEWERRLGPLADTVAPVAPSPDVLDRIEKRIGGALPVASDASALAELQHRVARWRRVAVAASALAACLLVFITAREALSPVAPRNYVGVFQKDDVSPAFLLSIDLDTRQLTIRPVAARPEPGKTYQLWIASDRLGPTPRSLGLIGEAVAGPSSLQLTSFEPDLLQQATFGVSLEPAGGSPTGVPTGPALHTRLFPARP